MHLAPLIRDLAIILGVAGLISLLFQRIRQPVVLGYIIAGIVIGPHTPPFQLVNDIPSIQTWAELGVVFLMFALGLEFSFRKLARVGGSAVITAGAEVLFFLPVGFVAGRLLGWSTMDSIFLGAMLAISSTTIIIKALDELKLKKHRFAELIFAVLIVEDLFAILLLVGLGTIAVSQTVSALALITAALKLILVVGGWFIAGYWIVPRFMQYVGRVGSDEMLTILSLGLCLALVVFANHFHYSTALGAFIMGSIIAESPMLPRIERNMIPVRDLFGAVFFVSIGMLIDPRILWEHLGTIAILCGVTILGKIISTGFGALLSGQSLRSSVQIGFGLAQIGEFSFIIAQLGMSLKVLDETVYPIIVAVSIVTTFTTPYLIRFSGPAAALIERILPATWVDFLNRYATHAESRRTGTGKSREWLVPFLRWLITGLITSVVFVLGSEWLLPFLKAEVKLDPQLAPLVAGGASFLTGAPFIFAMMTSFPTRGLRIVSRIFTVLWVSGLSLQFIPGKYVLVLTGATFLFFFIVFYRRLEIAYRWFEKSFLSTFQAPKTEHSTKKKSAHDHFSHLAPWDVHLVTLEIHPNSKLVLKTINEAALRVRYGVNIVAIRRGRRSIVTPLPAEILLPHDELVLLGSDEQVENIRKEFEDGFDGTLAPGSAEGGDATLGYELRKLAVSAEGPFSGKTIRLSGIRERFQAMVVGIEREGKRVINPDSDLKLQSGDLLWVAGQKEKLLKMTESKS